MIDAAGVHELLPHRFPMLLVDRVTECVPGQKLVGHKATTLNEPWFADAPPQTGFAYPPMLLVESWAQAAAVLAVRSNPGVDAVPLLGGLSAVTFDAPVYPGHIVTHHVRVMRTFDDVLICAGESTLDGARVLTIGQAVLAFRSKERL